MPLLNEKWPTWQIVRYINDWYDSIGGGGLQNVVEDLTPQLGGDLDVNGKAIVNDASLNLNFVFGNQANFYDDSSGAQVRVLMLGDTASTIETTSFYHYPHNSTADYIKMTWGGGNYSVSMFGGGSYTFQASAGTTYYIAGAAEARFVNYRFDIDQTVGAGQDNYVLTYDNGTGLISLEAPSVSTSQLVGTIDLASQVSGTLTAAFAEAGLINANVTINADGTLTGAGGGQASLNSLPGTLQLASYAATQRPVIIVGSLPGLPNADYPDGSVVTLTTDGKLYRNDGGTWTAAVPAADLSGTVDLASQVSGTLTAAFAEAGLINSNVTINADGTLSGAGAGQASLTSLPGFVDLGSKVSGTLTAAFAEAGLINSNVTINADGSLSGAGGGQASLNSLPGTIQLSSYAATQRPVIIVGALPSPTDPDYPAGSTVVLTTDNKLYRNTGAAWTAAVPTTDLSGTVDLDTQISGTLTAAFAESGLINSNVTINADGTLSGAGSGQASLTSLPGQVQVGSIAANAVDTAQLNALAVTAAKIETGTITATQIQAGTITGDRIAGTTITGDKMVANTIDTGQIAAGAITTDELDANAVTSVKILAGTIEGDRIASNTITAANIAGLTITAAEILGGTITGDKIAGTTITAANIDALTITAAQIAATTITGDKMVSGAIDTAQLAADAVTADKIEANTITAAEIAAGTITGDEIAANTITAGKMTIVDWTNMYPDNGDFEDSSFGAYTSATWARDATTSKFGSACCSVTASGTIKDVFTTDYIPVEPGEEFYFEGWYKTDAGVTSSGTDDCRICFVQCTDENKTTPSYPSIRQTTIPQTTWTQVTGTITIPSGKYFMRPGSSVRTQLTGGKMYVDGLKLYRRQSGELIVDGAITADKIGANAVTAGKIDALAVTAGTIASGVVDTLQLAAGAVTANEINVTNLNSVSSSTGALSVDGALSVGNTGYIRNSTTTYSSGDGFFLGYDSADYKFRIGNTTDNFLKWDGTSLTVRGDVSIGSYTASTTEVLLAANINRTNSLGQTWREEKKFQINKPGTVWVYYQVDLTTTSSTITTAGQIRTKLDGVVQNTRNISTTTPTTYSDLITTTESSTYITIETKSGVRDLGGEPLNAPIELHLAEVRATIDFGEAVITD